MGGARRREEERIASEVAAAAEAKRVEYEHLAKEAAETAAAAKAKAERLVEKAAEAVAAAKAGEEARRAREAVAALEAAKQAEEEHLAREAAEVVAAKRVEEGRVASEVAAAAEANRLQVEQLAKEAAEAAAAAKAEVADAAAAAKAEEEEWLGGEVAPAPEAAKQEEEERSARVAAQAEADEQELVKEPAEVAVAAKAKAEPYLESPTSAKRVVKLQKRQRMKRLQMRRKSQLRLSDEAAEATEAARMQRLQKRLRLAHEAPEGAAVAEPASWQSSWVSQLGTDDLDVVNILQSQPTSLRHLNVASSSHQGEMLDTGRVSPNTSVEVGCNPELPVLLGEQLPEASASSDDVALSMKSSGPALVAMLGKTGCSLKGLAGVDKLDILNMIAHQMLEKIQLRQKMALTLSDLNLFLELEGMRQGRDAKAAIESLLELRHKHLTRLGHYTKVGRAESPKSFDVDVAAGLKLALVAIPTQVVSDCFTGASLEPLPSQTGTCSSSAVLAEVVTPKRKHTGTDDSDIFDIEQAQPTSIRRLDVASSSRHGVDAGKVPPNTSLEAELSPELMVLLAEHGQGSLSQVVLAIELDGWLEPPEEEQQKEQQGEPSDSTERRAEAAREVDRILRTKEWQDVLCGSSLEEQRQDFQRIAKLLHPDKGYVDASDTRANMALRLALVAHKRADPHRGE